MLSFLTPYHSNYFFYAIFLVWLVTALFSGNVIVREYILFSFVLMTAFGFVCMIASINHYPIALSLFTQRYIYSFFFGMMFVPTVNFFNKQELKLMCYFAMICIFASSILSIIGLQKYPNASRELATGKYDTYNLSNYERIGIVNYGYVYGLCVLPISIISVIGSEKRSQTRVAYFLLLIIATVVVLMASYTIAIITIITGIILSFLIKKIKKISLKIVVSFSLLFLILGLFYIFKEPLSTFFLDFLSKNAPHIVYHRFEEIIDHFILKTDNSDLQRLSLYKDSLHCFINNIFIGVGNGNIEYRLGSHSEFLDILGSFGLFGFLYIGHYFYHNANVAKYFSGFYIREMLLVFIIFVVLCIFNPVSSGKTFIFSFLFLIPLIIFSCGNNEKNLVS